MSCVVITGANRGIGLELVRQISNRNSTSHVFALCRKTSTDLSKLASDNDKVKIVENIDISQDDCQDVLKTTFGDDDDDVSSIDLLIHNAGAYGPPKVFDNPMELLKSQSLENVSMDDMRFAFELNTLGPLRVTKALLPFMRRDTSSEEDGEGKETVETKAVSKIIIMTSLMGSMTDNGSGGSYAYRTSKAGVNMIGKSFAEDLKKDGIAVGIVHPGMVYTGFGSSGEEGQKLPRFKSHRDVEPSTKGVLDAIDSIDLGNTGSFLHGNYGDGAKPLPW